MDSRFKWLLNSLTGRAATDSYRVLITAAHPDDEVIGATTLIRTLRRLEILHTTDGSPKNLADALAAGCASRHEYADLRRAELMDALIVVGRDDLRPAQLKFEDQSCSFNLPALIRAVRVELEELRPDIVVTQPYEGGHPDHDSTAFAVAMAATRVASPPLLVEMTSYHLGANGILPGEFLASKNVRGITVELAVEERAAKTAMLQTFRSQQGTLQYFGAERERFRIAPRYNFSRAPHPGTLFYEKFDWGIRGEEWRRLAREAALEFTRARPTGQEHELAGAAWR
jgi:N-acetylglucosamine malate deacetylase 2